MLVFLATARGVPGALWLADTAGEKGHEDTRSAAPSCTGGRPCWCAIAPGPAPRTAPSPNLFPSREVKSSGLHNPLHSLEVSVSGLDLRKGLRAQKLPCRLPPPPYSYMI